MSAEERAVEKFECSERAKERFIKLLHLDPEQLSLHYSEESAVINDIEHLINQTREDYARRPADDYRQLRRIVTCVHRLISAIENLEGEARFEAMLSLGPLGAILKQLNELSRNAEDVSRLFRPRSQRRGPERFDAMHWLCGRLMEIFEDHYKGRRGGAGARLRGDTIDFVTEALSLAGIGNVMPGEQRLYRDYIQPKRRWVREHQARLDADALWYIDHETGIARLEGGTWTGGVIQVG